MDLEFIKKEKNEIEVKVIKEDIAFFDLIQNIASSKRDIEFISLKKADNLADEFVFYIKTKDKAAKDMLIECISEAEESLENIINSLEKTTPDKE